MNHDFLPELAPFRAEVQDFLAAELPADIGARVRAGKRLRKEDITRWQRILHRRGWGAPSWPAEWGGPGWSTLQQIVFDDECAQAGAPPQIAFGLRMLAPVLMRFGTEEQRNRHLPGIANGDVWWCQGYSEPGSGSDLASLKTRAVRDGDAYVITGQKTWTTLAQHADWMFCLVRTDSAAKPQEGISFVLIDMHAPGVSVRPIITVDGEHEINEVWLDAVRVPLDQRVGAENQGWTIAKFLLGHERSNIAGAGVAKRELARLRELAAKPGTDGRAALDDALFAARLAQLNIDALALEITQLRLVQREGPPGSESSMLKIVGSELLQRISECLVHAAGGAALPFERAAFEPDFDPVAGDDAALLAAKYGNWRKLSIYGGTNEIQHNILARALGL